MEVVRIKLRNLEMSSAEAIYSNLFVSGIIAWSVQYSRGAPLPTRHAFA